jgi:hypothetical protein
MSTLRRVNTTTQVDDLVVALADLYLDTEVRDGLPRVAEQIVNSGLSERELLAMWREQITPCVHWNLGASDSAWAGFNRGWLLEQIAERRAHPGWESLPLIGALLHRVHASGAESEFKLARALAARLSHVPVTERPRRVAVWEALAHVYFSADARAPRNQSSDRRSTNRLACNYASHVVGDQHLDRRELLQEFHAIGALFSDVLSNDQLKYLAESQVADWLDEIQA